MTTRRTENERVIDIRSYHRFTPATSLFARNIEVVVVGTLRSYLLGAYPEFTADARDGFTRVTGLVPDQRRLVGLVTFLDSLNAEIVAVTATRPTGSLPPATGA
ncbi:hypothetical protein [Subtercola endophyticus]|uniref:hypothetical protein n=1 Tax=Subtercola endophyticus TaxID=2895559 RepID=UPI001E35195F|nr:hypothetical protein [Subtercola endophyticus]UFS58593.1 hypothetical protein LQ955_16575 [Subtercola endophyticus]